MSAKTKTLPNLVCVVGEWKNWHRYLYVPGGWDSVKNDVVIDPAEAASSPSQSASDAKVLIVIREQTDWLQSVYKFVMSQLPWNRRSFTDYCTTPSGIVLLQAGHFDQTIRAYVDVFGSHARSACCVLKRSPGARSGLRPNSAIFSAYRNGRSHDGVKMKRHAQIARIQRFFPFIEQLPRGVKNALKPHAMRLIPGARGSILSSRDIRMLRGIYAASNQRTEKLIRQLSIVTAHRLLINDLLARLGWRFPVLVLWTALVGLSEGASIVLLLPLLNRVGIVTASAQSVANTLIEKGLGASRRQHHRQQFS